MIVLITNEGKGHSNTEYIATTMPLMRVNYSIRICMQAKHEKLQIANHRSIISGSDHAIRI